MPSGTPHLVARLGVLSYTINGGFGLLLGSSKKGTCEFKHEDGTVEKYNAVLSKLGLDIGVTDKAYMKWLVFTPVGNEPGKHVLRGEYYGLSAETALGIGLGANALVGGSNDKIGLQPFSVEGTTGLNLAVGLSKLRLDPAEEATN